MKHHFYCRCQGIVEEFDQSQGYGCIKPNDKPNQHIIFYVSE
jgi:cold shock CspA family protein